VSISVITPKKHIKNSIKLYIMAIDNTAKHANSHLVIMGKPEVGETQFILKIFADIRIQSYHQTNSVYFDYKGDVVDNHAGLLILPGETGF
jgi:Holliday junction resolvasome RuvABC ATP-dependent DNA helicase subunit